MAGVVKLIATVPMKVKVQKLGGDKQIDIASGKTLMLVCDNFIIEEENKASIVDGSYIYIEPVSFQKEFESNFVEQFNVLGENYTLSPSALLDFTVKFLEENGVKVALKEEEAQNG